MPEDDERAETPFPELPARGEVPHPPRLNPTLPPRAGKRNAAVRPPGEMGKNAVAITAASSFTMPVFVFAVGGYMLDRRLHHTTAWFAFAGVLIGLGAGMAALMNVLKRLGS